MSKPTSTAAITATTAATFDSSILLVLLIKLVERRVNLGFPASSHLCSFSHGLSARSTALVTGCQPPQQLQSRAVSHLNSFSHGLSATSTASANLSITNNSVSEKPEDWPQCLSHTLTHYNKVIWLISWCIKPSQPQRIK